MKHSQCLALALLGFLTLCSFPARADIAEGVNNPGKTFVKSDHPFSPIEWSEDFAISHDGHSSVRSGTTPNNQNAAFLTTLSGSGTISFWWKVSSELNTDKLFFLVDGAVAGEISGERNWVRISVTIPASPAVHILEWRYGKNGSGASGSDAGWVDEIAFVPTASDAAWHVDARLRSSLITNSVLVSGQPTAGAGAFQARATLDLQRLDEIALPPATSTLNLKINWAVANMSTGSPVPVDSGNFPTTATLATHNGAVPRLPATARVIADFPFTAGVPFEVNPLHPHRITLTATYTDENGNPAVIGTTVIENVRLLTLSGRLTAGPVEARFDSMGWSPGATTISGAGHILELDSAPDSVYLLDSPTTRFRLQFQSAYRDPETGDLVLQAGIPITIPGFSGSASNVGYRVADSSLTYTGLSGGNMTVRLPAGVGVGFSANARLLDSEIDIGPRLITPSGQPNFSTASAAISFLSHEQTPVIYAGSELVWHVEAGTFTMTGAAPVYVRSREQQWLADDVDNGDLTDPSSAVKASNEAPWRRTLGIPTDVTIAAAPGGVGILTANITLGGAPQTVAMHSPAGVSLPLTGSSTISVNNGAFTADSSIVLSGPIAISYDRDGYENGECGVSSAGALGMLSMTSATGALTMTRDGGWQAVGTLPGGSTVDWGGIHGTQPTHRLQNLGNVSLLIPGTWMNDAYTEAPLSSRAAGLLFSGLSSPTDPDLVERPLTGAAVLGLADYPGLNIRVSSGSPTASSYLAGVSIPGYQLKPIAKYYVQQAGVSGVHDAVTSSLPNTIRLYGYNSQLDGLRLSYLDSENTDSATSGGISLPAPSDFSVQFSELTFRTGGSLKNALLPPNSPEVILAYWGCPFTPDFLEFTSPRPESCTPTSPAYLTLSGRVGLGTISPNPVRGTLAFKPDGNLITPADNLVRGVDSSLPMPPGFAIKGRGNLTYPFSPSTRLRFNAFTPANWICNLFSEC